MNEEELLTARQARELEYHREHAESHENMLEKPCSYDVVLNKKRRWWNQNWEMYTYLLRKNLDSKNVLVVGCGFGEDAIYLARAGANVKAFDLSPESLSIAKKLAEREGLEIDFKEMAAENLTYEDNYFDVVVARDILHHVEIPETMAAIVKVSKPSAIFLLNEVYSHSFADKIRYSTFVDKWLYPRMINIIYGGKKPYITEDELKLSEAGVKSICVSIEEVEIEKYFNCIVTRVVPEKYVLLSKLDRLLLIILSPIAAMFGSRVIIGGALKTR